MHSEKGSAIYQFILALTFENLMRPILGALSND